MIKNISVSDLRANLKEVLDLVKKGNSLQITDHGKTVAEINPPMKRSKDKIKKEIEKIRAGSKINGDMVNPIFDGTISMDWNNLSK